MHSVINCCNNDTYVWAMQQNWPCDVTEGLKDAPLSINIHHQDLLVIKHNQMTLSIGPSGQFGQWYAAIPLKHPVIKLLKSVANKNTHIVDATGGIGRDSLLIALFLNQFYPQAKLSTFERNPMMASLIKWQTQHIQLSWKVYQEDFMQCQSADIVVIDPMFPPHPKTAKPQKYTQIIQMLTVEDVGSTEEDLIAHAKAIKAKHIICKSPPWISSDIWHMIT